MTEKLFTEQDTIMDRAIVPEPIYDERPEFIDLYYAAVESVLKPIDRFGAKAGKLADIPCRGYFCERMPGQGRSCRACGGWCCS